MPVVPKPGMLVRALAVTAFVAVLLTVLLGSGLTSGTAGPSGATAPNPVPGSDLLAAPTPYVVAGTNEKGLNVRSCPAATCGRVGWIGEGRTFLAECWTRGTTASGDDRWVRGSANGHTGYAAAHFLRGSGAPECGATPAQRT